MTTSSSRSPLARRGLVAAGAVLGAGALIFGLVSLGGTSASTSDSMLGPSQSPTTTQQTKAKLDSIYSKGNYSVQLSVANNTTQTMTYIDDPAKSEVGGGHWGTRPVTLAPGTSMITTAYSDQLDGFSWQVVYQLDNGEYATVNLNSGELTNKKPHNISVEVGTGWDDGGITTPDLTYTADTSNSNGAHSWVDVSFKPATN